MEKTFLMVKPDGVQRQLIGEIVGRFERKGFQLAGAKLMTIPVELAEKHYGEHKGKPFFEDLIKFMTSGPVQVQILEGENAIVNYRDLMGNTNPQDAAPGTIRADFAESIDANAVHGSDSPESAKREIAYFFE